MLQPQVDFAPISPATELLEPAGMGLRVSSTTSLPQKDPSPPPRHPGPAGSPFILVALFLFPKKHRTTGLGNTRSPNRVAGSGRPAQNPNWGDLQHCLQLWEGWTIQEQHKPALITPGYRPGRRLQLQHPPASATQLQRCWEPLYVPTMQELGTKAFSKDA